MISHDLGIYGDSAKEQRQGLRQELDLAWDRKLSSVDWLGLECMLIGILHTHNALSYDEKVRAAREALDAFTGRGHFNPEDYLV